MDVTSRRCALEVERLFPTELHRSCSTRLPRISLNRDPNGDSKTTCSCCASYNHLRRSIGMGEFREAWPVVALSRALGRRVTRCLSGQLLGQLGQL